MLLKKLAQGFKSNGASEYRTQTICVESQVRSYYTIRPQYIYWNTNKIGAVSMSWEMCAGKNLFLLYFILSKSVVVSSELIIQIFNLLLSNWNRALSIYLCRSACLPVYHIVLQISSKQISFIKFTEWK